MGLILLHTEEDDVISNETILQILADNGVGYVEYDETSQKAEVVPFTDDVGEFYCKAVREVIDYHDAVKRLQEHKSSVNKAVLEKIKAMDIP